MLMQCYGIIYREPRQKPLWEMSLVLFMGDMSLEESRHCKHKLFLRYFLTRTRVGRALEKLERLCLCGGIVWWLLSVLPMTFCCLVSVRCDVRGVEFENWQRWTTQRKRCAHGYASLMLVDTSTLSTDKFLVPVPTKRMQTR
eukprot:GHVS01083186.1.p1 GENE.GHVS01083186.1~~GHVS01083186.1.p1  ORF type:complete len:142 (+),score=5.93 GHVS01083186.1:119-544(+)